jgi:hypothetical protein
MPEITSELDTLKQEADSLGVEYSHLIGIETLRSRIEEKKAELMEQGAPGTPILPKEDSVVPPVNPSIAGPVPSRPMTQKEKEMQRKNLLRDQQMRLRRVIIHNNDDNERDLVGDLIRVGNDICGSHAKFIPFDNEAGCHIPQIMLDTLRDKTTQKWKTIKDASGASRKESFVVPKYTITMLPDLTEDELKELAEQQKARGSIDL